ncbi:MAG: NTP transferase domain-containing protein [Candidatus Velthaea sp.]
MTIVILAAGAARRMGRQKLLLPIDGEPMVARVIGAAAAWPTVVVAGPAVATVLRDAPVRVIVNDRPERGMVHSLRLADEAVDPAEPIAVLLADVPDVSQGWIRHIIDAYHGDVDVVAPRTGDQPAHPVVFGPAARRKIVTLADGDTLRELRDDPSLRRREVEVLDGSALTDIDTPADYAARARRP